MHLVSDHRTILRTDYNNNCKFELSSVYFRCVAESQRSFALGVQWIFIRVLGKRFFPISAFLQSFGDLGSALISGSIPGPIVVGALIDQSCNLWQQLCNGSYGACRSYDNNVLSITMGIVAFITKLLSVIMFTLALYAYKPPNNNLSSTKVSPTEMDLRTVCGQLDTADDTKEPVSGLTFKVLSSD